MKYLGPAENGVVKFPAAVISLCVCCVKLVTTEICGEISVLNS